jgi:DNA polymerase-1
MLSPGKLAERLRDGAEAARMSRRLVGLITDAPLPVALDELAPPRPSKARLDALFADLGYPRWEAAVDAYRG